MSEAIKAIEMAKKGHNKTRSDMENDKGKTNYNQLLPNTRNETECQL